jgi:hypothetical protein
MLAVLALLAPGTGVGIALDGAGDVDGDGTPDVIVGQPNYPYAPDLNGCAYVYSGKTGELIRFFEGDDTDDLFGGSVAGAGDVNGDGYADVVVGTGGTRNAFRGYARVYSGRNGAVLIEVRGLPGQSGFGCSVDGAGDVNGDGFDDVIVGSSEARTLHATTRPMDGAFVYSGIDGSLLHSLEVGADLHPDGFGATVCGLGDIDGDGRSDFAVGCPRRKDGFVRVYSGVDACELFELRDDGRRFGWWLSSSPDQDRDGVPEIVVGVPRDSAQVFSGATGKRLLRIGGRASIGFGDTACGIGDVDGDQIGDVAGGCREIMDSGDDSHAAVYSGVDGRQLQRFEYPARRGHYETRVAACGDLDGDESADFLVSAASVIAYTGRTGDLLFEWGPPQ